MHSKELIDNLQVVLQRTDPTNPDYEVVMQALAKMNKMETTLTAMQSPSTVDDQDGDDYRSEVADESISEAWSLGYSAGVAYCAANPDHIKLIADPRFTKGSIDDI